ncbi:MAG: hydrogenase formation protein HypD [Candidatus Omnitrophica bacterium CG07_land_8_20_14_0_80_42_15]|uniref:Hydrogenase formation protein HypD n=1 Tax=Candidatus Aquitaenariimonas noxiae TaxID=1974741 RepID=A0A2J0L0T9_9BACT|nr:MAG: hydrogenase formation protein HypD [Candidatus Omnitrophica bacterium CG07_land_8_20_14_0_80_42_15]
MKYVDEFRDIGIAKKILKDISCHVDGEYKIMEVCGTHTQNIFRYGLRQLLPKEIKLFSGPGCPVCVSPTSFIDKAIAYSRISSFIIATFGDMLKVPGSSSSLEKEKSKGGDIRIVYSSLDAIGIAARNPGKKIVFLGIGFETTIPTVAASVIEAKKNRINNFYVLSGHKIMPPALEALLEDKKISIDGFILPAHVSAIIGSVPYEFIPNKFNIDCVIAGFEPLDILHGIYMLLKSRFDGLKPRVRLQYTRVVKRKGNRKAIGLIKEVFRQTDSEWRGLGNIPGSGLVLSNAYKQFDIEMNRKIIVSRPKENPLCLCGEVLKGLKVPLECKLFGKRCTPQAPVGACMVSGEGTCATYYKYGEGGLTG